MTDALALLLRREKERYRGSHKLSADGSCFLVCLWAAAQLFLVAASDFCLVAGFRCLQEWERGRPRDTFHYPRTMEGGRHQVGYTLQNVVCMCNVCVFFPADKRVCVTCITRVYDRV